MRLGTYYRARLWSHLGITAYGQTVLDVGCFDGYWLSTQRAKHKYALDIDIDRKYKGIRYIRHTALDIPFKDDAFDQIFAFDVLEHIEAGKEKQFLKELIRVCKKGGEIILSTPSKTITMFPPVLTNQISKMWGHTKCNGYSKEELKKLLSSFDGIEYRVLDNNAPLFRLLFIGVRFLWEIWGGKVKTIIESIARYDARHKKGNFGFYLIKITKRTT